MRDRTKEPLHLEGHTVVVDEMAPAYFSYVIQWRNDKTLNRYINQPTVLTMESQRKWYEEYYLRDDTQGMVIISDKKTRTPFATHGWTDYDTEKKQCISGRLLLSDSRYALNIVDGVLTLADYLYKFVNKMYSHVVKDNERSLRWDYMLGFQQHAGKIEYPDKILVNGMELYELYRDIDMYKEAKSKLPNTIRRLISLD